MANTRTDSFRSLTNAEAINAVDEVGPRIYKIHGVEKTLKFIASGCGGSNSAKQIATAQLMTQVAKEHTLAFQIGLGDNVYDYGVNSPQHEHFNTFFHYKYKAKPAFFMTLGNHDANRHAKASLSSNQPGRDTSINQVAHTYRNPQTVKLFKQENIHYASLPSWSMPYFYYAIDIGKLRIFCLNSNSYAKDYLNLITKPGNQQSRNQAYWLKQHYDEAISAGMTVFIAWHHPLITSGKRAFPEKFDSTHYLSHAELEQIKESLGLASNSYNKLLKQILQNQQISKIDCVLAAHDHFLSYHSDASLRQITSGGGGGHLQSRESYKDHPYVACHIKEHGISMLTVNVDNPKEFEIDFFTTDHKQLHYKSSTQGFAHYAKNEASQLKTMRQAVQTACQQHFQHLKNEEQPRSNKDETTYNGGWVANSLWVAGIVYNYLAHNKGKAFEAETAQSLDGFFQQVNLPEFKDCLTHLNDSLIQIEQKLKDSHFINCINNSFSQHFNKSLAELLTENKPTLPSPKRLQIG